MILPRNPSRQLAAIQRSERLDRPRSCHTYAVTDPSGITLTAAPRAPSRSVASVQVGSFVFAWIPTVDLGGARVPYGN
jgi:hypothetical protein